jgi:hypothetical protein
MWLINALLAISLLFQVQQQQESSGWTPYVDPDQFGEGYQDFLREIPKFDPSRAWYDPFSGCWNDGNYCVYPNKDSGFGPWGIFVIYRSACGDADFCGLVSRGHVHPLEETQGPRRSLLRPQHMHRPLQGGARPVPARSPAVQGHHPPVVDRGPGSGGGGGGPQPARQRGLVPRAGGGSRSIRSGDRIPSAQPGRGRPGPGPEGRDLPPRRPRASRDLPPLREGAGSVRAGPRRQRGRKAGPLRGCWTQIGDPPVRWPGDLKPGAAAWWRSAIRIPSPGTGGWR